MVDFMYRFMPTILPLKMEVNYEKKKNQKTSYLLIMFDYDHYIRALVLCQDLVQVKMRNFSHF